MFKKYEKVQKKDYDSWYQKNQEYRDEVASDPRRLRFHLMPKTGWLNDPNGLCQMNGIYHIFYQYTPFETTGEIKMWGHYTTEDFIYYKDYGSVLFPDSDLDAHGVYSGSAFVENNEMHCFYTGNIKYFDRDDYDYINSGRGSNTILVTSKDGNHFTEKQLLLTTDDYPENMSNHVRDPKVFKRDGIYYMVLGARGKDSKGLVLLYQSKDMKNWKFINEITMKETFGYMWECPDIFEIDGQLFLTCCPQGVETQGIDYANVHQSTVMKLKYDFQTNEYELGDARILDRGFDFYAQQSFQDEKGRRIMIGWMGIPDADYVNPTVDAGWQHALTIPRELMVRDGKLMQNPIQEMEDLRGEKTTETFSEEKTVTLQKLVYESVISFEKCDSMNLTVRKGVQLSYENHVLTLDLGERGAGRTTRSVRLEQMEHLRIYADTSSVEIFVNHGLEVFTSRIYSMEEEICISGDCSGKMDVYSLETFVTVHLQA